MSWCYDKPKDYIYKRGPYRKVQRAERRLPTKDHYIVVIIYEDEKSITREITRVA